MCLSLLSCSQKTCKSDEYLLSSTKAGKTSAAIYAHRTTDRGWRHGAAWPAVFWRYSYTQSPLYLFRHIKSGSTLFVRPCSGSVTKPRTLLAYSPFEQEVKPSDQRKGMNHFLPCAPLSTQLLRALYSPANIKTHPATFHERENAPHVPRVRAFCAQACVLAPRRACFACLRSSRD
mgnify:CR=1 FL=1